MTRPSRAVALSPRLYPPPAIAAAMATFKSHCEIDVRDEGGATLLSCTVMPGAAATACDDFLNYLLCAAVEQHLGLVG